VNLEKKIERFRSLNNYSGVAKVVEAFPNRMSLLNMVGQRDGFLDTGPSGCVCPYCFTSFASVIKGDVLRELMRDIGDGKVEVSEPF
jgi:hypothetical protein